MSKPLIILESPNKVRTVEKFLGKDYKLLASTGHIIDLPSKKMAIDIEHGYKPQYQQISKKKKIIDDIKAACVDAPAVYLATDPDREGEAIAWHVADVIRKVCPNKPIFRIGCKEINEKEFRTQLANPGQLDENMFNSQQARRIVDRLVGYSISPILWKKVQKQLSAGRVQSVAVRLIVDRENEIRNYQPIEFWEILASLKTPTGCKIKAELASDGDKTIYQDASNVEKYHPKGVIANEAQAKAIVARSKAAPFSVKEVKRQSKSIRPEPPFTTSTMSSKASSVYKFTSKKTMDVAQKLFEGHFEGAALESGLITYHRTDSVRVSDQAISDCRQFIQDTYGKAYMPEKPNHYEGSGKKKTSKKDAPIIQDAHEAIRPTDVTRTPESLAHVLPADALKLYTLIWKRFVASQMAQAVNDTTTVYIENGDLTYKLSGSIPKFEGFRKVYGGATDNDVSLPEMKVGDPLECLDVLSTQKATQPPRRYTEAEFIQLLTDTNIGRPSTYATIISNIQEKKYVEMKKNTLFPTELGERVTALLITGFADIMNPEFTGNMETWLDNIAEGGLDWVKAVDKFYKPFEKEVKDAEEKLPNLKAESKATSLKCEKCGAELIIRWGKNGSFVACSNYPDCKFTSDFKENADGSIELIRKNVEPLGKCPEPNCGGDLVIKVSRYGKFIACTNYPACKHTESLSLHVKCPREGCGGNIVKKHSKKGKIFYGCSNYPKCDFMTWNEPTDHPCPDCAANNVAQNLEIVRRQKVSSYLCPKCGYSEHIEENQGDEN